MYPQTSPCQHHDCKHGICFTPPGANGYVCKCAPGYSGKRCEYLTSLSFLHNTSYVELEPLNLRPQANVTLTFATEQQNGVLLYTGDKQHLAVELFRGRIRVSYDVGNYPVSTMFSYELLSDGEYHRVEMLAVKKKFTLRVDGGLARSIVNEGENEYMDRAARQPLFVSGVPADVGRKSLNSWHLRNATSFSGCVKEVIINNKVVDFLQAANVRHKVSPGCSQYQDQGDDEQLQDATENPCQNGRHKCRNGAKCLPKQPTSVANVPYGNQLPPSPADLYECRCTEHFEGKFCENRRRPPQSQRDRARKGKKSKKRGNSRRGRGKKCRKQRYRDYYIEPNGCRSKKSFKMAKCVGSGSDSCVANKTKMRRIKFVCEDGRKFRKEVEIVKRCGKRKENLWGR